MFRVASQNDWVVFILVGCIFLYIFMLLSLKRDSSVDEFLRQKFPDSSNNFLSWAIIGVVYSLVSATFISHFIPVVPAKVRALQIFGYELNKFGFSFVTISLFYLLKNLISYLYFAGAGSLKKWSIFYFTASKFYFCISIILMILCVVNFFYEVNFSKVLGFYFVGLVLLFIFKLVYYLAHPANILPHKWYYKFLYICTLQIAPVLVLWRILFF